MAATLKRAAPMCRDTIEKVQVALHELEQRVARSEDACAESVGGLRADTAASVAALREQRERTDATTAELRGAVHDVETASSSRTDALQGRLQARPRPQPPPHQLAPQQAGWPVWACSTWRVR